MRVYRMAERNIGIESLSERVHTRCAAYRTEGEPDFVVETTSADIDFERVQSAREDQLEGRQPRPWSDEYLEELAVYPWLIWRLIAGCWQAETIGISSCLPSMMRNGPTDISRRRSARYLSPLTSLHSPLKRCRRTCRCGSSISTSCSMLVVR